MCGLIHMCHMRKKKQRKGKKMIVSWVYFLSGFGQCGPSLAVLKFL